MGASDWVLRAIADEDRQRFVAEGWWAEQTLGQLLAERLSTHRDLPFVIHSATRPWRGTFGDLLDLSRRVAAGLSRLGVGVGDVVSFQTPNWIEGAATFYGAALLGAVAAPVVHFYGSRELAYILRQCEPRVHVTASRFGPQDFLANLASIPDLRAMEVVVVGDDLPAEFSSFDQLTAADPITAPSSADPAGPALVGWTSGTTANPKGVIHSHQTVQAEVRQLGATSPPQNRPALIANPISHAIG
ncbi:MAG TPA: AMP-binding protein, partial [Acidimicrobiales bacterium]|nr:AMP-binding protein [Acidimicrobiales bacterium]